MMLMPICVLQLLRDDDEGEAKEEGDEEEEEEEEDNQALKEQYPSQEEEEEEESDDDIAATPPTKPFLPAAKHSSEKPEKKANIMKVPRPSKGRFVEQMAETMMSQPPPPFDPASQAKPKGRKKKTSKGAKGGSKGGKTAGKGSGHLLLRLCPHPHPGATPSRFPLLLLFASSSSSSSLVIPLVPLEAPAPAPPPLSYLSMQGKRKASFGDKSARPKKKARAKAAASDGCKPDCHKLRPDDAPGALAVPTSMPAEALPREPRKGKYSYSVYDNSSEGHQIQVLLKDHAFFATKAKKDNRVPWKNYETVAEAWEIAKKRAGFQL